MFISSRISDSFEVNFFSVDTRIEICQENYIFLQIQRGAILIRDDAGSSSLSGNDMFLVKPDHTYTLQYLSANQIFAFTCRRNFIESNLPVEKELICNSPAGRMEDYEELSNVLRDLANYYSVPGKKAAFISSLYRLLDLLINQYSRDPEISGTAETGGDTSDLRIKKIKQYIEQHYHLPLYLQTLANEMYLSPQYLSKFFHQTMGITFNKYVNNVRLEHALEELTGTRHTITEIALNNGFSNASAFNKQFRDVYQISPSAYRREFRPASKEPERTETPLPKLHDPNSETDPQKIDISFSAEASCHPSWRDTINIGPLSNALGISFHDVLTKAQKEIHFRYVRFQNMFSDDVLPCISTQDTFNFTRMDMIFDFFREIHLIPFIELNYKFPRLSLTTQFWINEPEEKLFAAEKPAPYALKALRAILLHYINRYGYTEVSKWRFELWQKNDEQLHPLETAAEFWEKFCSYRDVIKELLPDCRVGGPGFNTARPSGEFCEILREMCARRITPDFLSIYIYCYMPTEYKIQNERGSARSMKMLSPDPDFPIYVFRQYENLINDAGCGSVPLYVTEFNSGLSGYNHLSGSCFQAAFLCKNALELSQKTDCLAYWIFADISGTLTADPQIYAAGLGLIEQHGLPKPAFFSFVFLSRLGRRLVGLGREYAAATNTRNTFQFLIFHYVHYNLNYCCTYHTRLDIGNTYDIFEEEANRSYQVHLRDLPQGRYKCLVYILNRSYGSILDKFIHILNYGKTSASELNYLLNNMQPEEVNYFLKEAKPRLEILYRSCSDGTLDFELELEPHEVRLIILERKS